ncbi:CocE/NonD family hydrolase [Nakamurella flavida]
MLRTLIGAAADLALGRSPRATRYDVERDIAVRMPDGVTLLGDRYAPRRQSGPMPVVLIRLPYGRAGAFGQVYPAPLARRGFQVFIQATRGTFGSGGQFRPFTTEHEDGMATLAWLREQPWCDGRVAMVGGSYFGHTQWAVAPYADPPLVCASPHITSADIAQRIFYPGGAPSTQTALGWSAGIGRQERGGLDALRPGKQNRLRRALDRLPLQAADVAVAGAPVPFWRDFAGHAAPGDDFWSGADHAAQVARMPPVSMVTGWWDLFLAGNLDDFTALQRAGVPARLVVGPWQHGEPAELKAAVNSDLVWLDHHLRGGPAPGGPPVRIHLQQSGSWLGLDLWPPADRIPTPLYLAPSGQLSGAAPTGDEDADRFTYDPADPTPTVGGPLLSGPGKQADNAPVEARDDVLVFTGPVLDADLDLVGPVGARVYARTSLPHADVFVRLCDVDPAGVSRNITDGIRRLDPRTVPATDVTVGADGVLAVDVELFPTAYRVGAGHRLRVQVSGGAFPRFARNHGTGEPFATATGGVRCTFEVFHDAERPSHLILPIL